MTQDRKIPAAIGAIVVVAVLGLGLQVRDIAEALGTPIPPLPMPYGGAILDNAIAVALALVAAFALSARGAPLVRALGLHWPGWKGPALTLAATAPFWIGLGATSPLSTDVSVLSLVMLAGVFPLAEEIAFRGFGFVFARRTLGWRVAVAAFVQALAFGLVHWLGMGGGGGIALEVFAITAFGGLVFAAIDALDDWSIWSGWILHASLNAAWNVFVVSESAATGWFGNTLRVASAALAIALLWFLRRRAAR